MLDSVATTTSAGQLCPDLVCSYFTVLSSLTPAVNEQPCCMQQMEKGQQNRDKISTLHALLIQ